METTGKKNCFGPPQTIRDEGEELKECLDCLNLELSQVYTLLGLSVKLENALNDVKRRIAFRNLQMLDKKLG